MAQQPQSGEVFLNVRVPADLRRAAKHLALIRALSLQELVGEVLRAELAREAASPVLNFPHLLRPI